MRREIAAAVAALLVAAPAPLAADPLSPAIGQQVPSLSQVAPQPWRDAGAGTYRVIFIAAGAVVGVIAANFLTGGMITPLLTLGAAAAPTAVAPATVTAVPAMGGVGLGVGALLVAAPAAMANMGTIMPPLTLGAAAAPAVAAAGATAAPAAGLAMGLGMGAEMSVMVAAPTAMAEIGAPVDAALRDGYTTPTVLAAAIGESARRAGAMVLESGSYVGSVATGWLTGP